jgi:hypothetical protein
MTTTMKRNIRRLDSKRSRQYGRVLVEKGKKEFLQSEEFVFPYRGENIVISLFK